MGTTQTAQSNSLRINHASLLVLSLILALLADNVLAVVWKIDSTNDWKKTIKAGKNVEIKDGKVTPTNEKATYTSRIRKFEHKQLAKSIELVQSPEWLNWKPTEKKIGPTNLEDAPVLLTRGPNDYWVFGMYGTPQSQSTNFKSKSITLEGHSIPLHTSPFPNQFNAPGGLKESKGGYHAWQSRDMTNWIHHGPVTEAFSRWVTTAEYVDGKLYLYYDYPNDQDPHLYIDNDLTDGVPGNNIGIVFRDPSDGSDCGVIRDIDGSFHLIYEDWSPIRAQRHSWDSPLAGHAISTSGKGSFRILPPAIDHRTNAQGTFQSYEHPHWMQHPDWETNTAIFEVHNPTQDAYGDWAAICIGGRYYLFGDFHPSRKDARNEMSIAWFTSEDIHKPFVFCSEIGSGHPDPDIAFAEGKFYLITQTDFDYISPGPWVETVQVRVGSDTKGNQILDSWTDWHVIKESYDYIPGYAKQISRTPATLKLDDLPAGFSFGFEIRIKKTTQNKAMQFSILYTYFLKK